MTVGFWGRPRVGVSSCLLGQEVRFNGGHKRYRFLTDSLDPYVDWVPYCPEMEIGLGTPREAIRLTAARRQVNRSGTADHTAAMAALPLPADLDGYVFKAKSPSCGIRAIPRYRDDGQRGDGQHDDGQPSDGQPSDGQRDDGQPSDGQPSDGQPSDGQRDDGQRDDGQRDDGQPSDGQRDDGLAADHAGPGLYAARVLARFPLLAAEDEGRLNDAGLREAFAERIFAAARLRSVFRGSWSAGDLVTFHARHKLQLLAHNPMRYLSAGQVVAAAGAAPREQTVALYRDVFLAAMASPASRGRNANALQHAYSRIGRELDRPRRHDLVARIEAYRRGEEPLSVPIALLAHYASGGGFPWLAGQTYLQPFPSLLRLRHSV